MLRKLLSGWWSGAGGDPVKTAFGVLERDVLDILWTEGDLAVRDVQTRLAEGRDSRTRARVTESVGRDSKSRDSAAHSAGRDSKSPANVIAYTTVMTTLDRLFKKGILTRRRAGRAFRYSAAVSREQLQASIAGRVLSGLLQSRDGAAVPVLSNLVESVGDHAQGAELLRTLEELVRSKRQQLLAGKSRRDRS